MASCLANNVNGSHPSNAIDKGSIRNEVELELKFGWATPPLGLRVLRFSNIYN